MKRLIFILSSVIGCWVAFQIPSVNSALYLFIVLGINPWTNKPIPANAIFFILAVFGACMSVIIFNKELNILIDAMLDWVKLPDNKKLALQLKPLKENRKLNYSLKINTPDIKLPMPKLPKINISININFNAKSKIKFILDYLPSVSEVKRRINYGISFLGSGINVVVINLFNGLIFSRNILVKYLFIPLKVSMYMSLMGLGLFELYSYRTAKKLLFAAYHKIVYLIQTVCAVIRDLAIYTLAAAGYALFIVILLSFIVWRISEPYFKIFDRWLAEKLHQSDALSHLIDVLGEMGSSVSNIRSEAKSIRRSLYR